MDVSLYQAAAAMNATARWQELIADNLAGASTPGSRRSEVSFSSVQAGLASGVPGSGYVIPSASSSLNFEPGENRPTGGATDLALEGPGMFTVQLPGGQKAYTRDGEFQVSAQGQLLTTQGFPVLGDSGPIQLDSGNSSPITVAATGEISQGSERKGKIQVTEFDSPNLLTAMGGSLYRADDPALKPTAATATQVRQGFVESSNTSPTAEMASLITAMRLFESNQKVLQMQSDRMSKEISDLGSPA